MPSQPIATWITPCSSRKVQVSGTSNRRHTIGLIPNSHTLNCTEPTASGLGDLVPGSAAGSGCFAGRGTRPAYRGRPYPVAGTTHFLMVPWFSLNGTTSIPRSGEDATLYPAQLLSTNQPIHAPRWRIVHNRLRRACCATNLDCHTSPTQSPLPAAPPGLAPRPSPAPWSTPPAAAPRRSPAARCPAARSPAPPPSARLR